MFPSSEDERLLTGIPSIETYHLKFETMISLSLVRFDVESVRFISLALLFEYSSTNAFVTVLLYIVALLIGEN